jgi:hypothetical protein
LGSLFDPETFLRMMRLLGAYDVGHAADGSPLRPPKRLVEALPQADCPASPNGENGNGNAPVAGGAAPCGEKLKAGSGQAS